MTIARSIETIARAQAGGPEGYRLVFNAQLLASSVPCIDAVNVGPNAATVYRFKDHSFLMVGNMAHVIVAVLDFKPSDLAMVEQLDTMGIAFKMFTEYLNAKQERREAAARPPVPTGAVPGDCRDPNCAICATRGM